MMSIICDIRFSSLEFKSFNSSFISFSKYVFPVEVISFIRTSAEIFNIFTNFMNVLRLGFFYHFRFELYTKAILQPYLQILLKLNLLFSFFFKSFTYIIHYCYYFPHLYFFVFNDALY